MQYLEQLTMELGGYIYIMTNRPHGVLYVGVTSDLERRVAQHKLATGFRSFTARYGLSILVYFERFPSIQHAIAREKQLKGGSRSKKLALIETMNPDWLDLLPTAYSFNRMT